MSCEPEFATIMQAKPFAAPQLFFGRCNIQWNDSLPLNNTLVVPCPGAWQVCWKQTGVEVSTDPPHGYSAGAFDCLMECDVAANGKPIAGFGMGDSNRENPDTKFFG